MKKEGMADGRYRFAVVLRPGVSGGGISPAGINVSGVEVMLIVGRRLRLIMDR
jgi:hypothetical protein